ncbi:SDR family NAD(P)-dependent oxidoreductase [Indiicoccus explosivorum]|uniref:SDR family NAD(P)-dependent oxidoreductase n=1 Tax=Indiicoccus explosivorum TaxID=1917864 RepID=UPI000B4551BB|nr:SDR family oxidoreductase [Indiicoccus explosivorum]
MAIFGENALGHKHILITGATGGIGAETAKAALKMGAKVTVTGRNGEKLARLAAELKELADPAGVFSQTADLTVAEERARLVENAEEKLGFINGLVNSAGISGGRTVEELEEDFVESLMRLNYTSTLFLTQLVYRRMMEHKEGDIVNLSSLSGLRGTYGNTAYAASKFAVIGWTQSMALEAIEHGIRVNAVCPGYVDTEMAYSSIRRKADRRGIPFEEALAEAEAAIPSGRMTTAEEVANTVVFLLTDAARNIVGESVKISGGGVMR